MPSAPRSPSAPPPLTPELAQLVHDGYQFQLRQQFDEAARRYRKVLRKAPEQIEVVHLLGIVRASQRREAEAVPLFEQVVAQRPGDARAWYNLALAQSTLRRKAEAAEAMERAFALDRSLPLAGHILLPKRRPAWDWRDSDLLAAKLRECALGRDLPPPPGQLTVSFDEPGLILASARRRAHPEGAPPPPQRFGHAAQKARAGRIRIGYFSADFRRHPTTFLISRLLETHDRDRFEVFALSVGEDDGSPYRKRIEQGVDRFVDFIKTPTTDLAAAIAALELDVVVDLMGHTEGERLRMFAHRPAPIQVSFLGYPGTSGAAFMDYLIADPICVPFSEAPFFSEQIVHLPDCYQPNDPDLPVAERPSRADCGLPDDAFVFCAFNTAYKLTPETFSSWMRILGRVPGSVLWVLAEGEEAQANLRREAATRGIAPERLVFAPKAPLPEHLARLPLADLFLDTFPYTAHTTASDAMRMGLPLVTRMGRTFATRVAASILHQLGLDDCATTSPEAFEELAVALALDRARLANLRVQLATARPASPLFDIDRYARHLESAYETMVARFRAGEPPRAFAVAPTDA